MDKAYIEKFVDALKELGREEYTMVVANDDLNVYNNNTSGKIYLGDDVITFVRTKHDFTREGAYDIFQIPYSSIEFIDAVSLSFTDGLALMKKLGCPVDEWENFIKNTPITRDFHIKTDGSNAGLEAMKDSEGNLTLPNGSSGYVV